MFPMFTSQQRYVYPLDIISATPVMAISVARKLRQAYSGNCILVRRDSDNDQLAVGYVGASLNIAALLTFVGGSTGYVVTKYDNSGNGQDATESNASNQPIIVQSGVLVTVNALPSVYYQASPNNSLTTVNAINWGATARSSFIVKKLVDTSIPIWPLTGNDGSGNQSYAEVSPNIYGVARQGLQEIATATITNSLELELMTLRYGKTALYQELFRNGVLIGDGNAAVDYPNITDKIVFGCYPGFSPNFYMSEFVAFDSAISDADESAFTRNTIPFFGI